MPVLDGRLGTTEVDGSTDFARWVPLADFPLSERTAEFVDLAVRLLAGEGPPALPAK